MMPRSIAAPRRSTTPIMSASWSTTTAGDSAWPKAMPSMTIWKNDWPRARSSRCPPSPSKVTPTGRHTRTPVPTPRNSRASTRTGSSRAASGTICLRKLRRPLSRRSWKSPATDQGSPAPCAVSGIHHGSPDVPGRRGEATVVAGGKLSTSTQRQLLEDVGEMGLHGRLGDPESSCGLEIAEPIDHEVHDLLLSSAQSLAKGQLSRPRIDRPGRQLRDGQGDYPIARPHLALMDDADGLEEVLDGGALGEDSTNPCLQGVHGPSFVSVGARQDDPRPHTIQSKLPTDLEGPPGLRVHEEDLGDAIPQYFPYGRGRDLAHHEQRAIGAEEAPEAGPEKGAVTEEGGA